LDSDEVNQLAIMEALGTLTLAVHHLRGRINWLVTAGACEFKDVASQAEFNRHNELVAELEETLWEIVPPRALLMALRKYRLTGELDPEVAELMEADYRGRIPYSANAMQIDEILKRIADVKSYDGGEVIKD
jgi:hypothetical protein